MTVIMFLYNDKKLNLEATKQGKVEMTKKLKFLIVLYLFSQHKTKKHSKWSPVQICSLTSFKYHHVTSYDDYFVCYLWGPHSSNFQ